MAVQTGYASYYKPVQPVQPPASPLAMAASGGPSAQNPFGFQTGRNTTGYGGAPPPATAPVKGATAATSPVVPKTTVTAPSTYTVNPSAAQQAPTVPPVPGGYDINTDPTLQSVNALTGESDQQANADALRQRQQILEAYGSPDLAKAVLGDQNVANVARGNPTSTLAQLAQQRDLNLKNLDEALNQQNLGYSGYRITQEQQAANDYQNQLANAAAQVNSGLNTVSSNLAAALSQNQAQRIAAQQAAADRLAQAAAAASATTPSTTATGNGTGTGTTTATAPPVSASDIFTDAGTGGPSSGPLPPSVTNVTPNLSLPLQVSGSFQAPSGLARALQSASAIPDQVSGSFQFNQPPPSARTKKLVAAG